MYKTMNPLPDLMRRSSAAFSLVEVTLAIGVAACALMPVVGLLPVGLNLYKRAAETSLSSQIMQQVLSEVQQTDFDILVGNAGTVNQQFPIYYFDEQGTPRGNANSSGAQASEAIYHVAFGVVRDSTAASLARVTVDILSNPANKTLERDTVTGGIKADAGKGIAPSRFSVLVARNK